MATTLTSV